MAPSSGGGQIPSWAPALYPHLPASSSRPSPGARPTLAALLPAPARVAYERYVQSGPGRRPSTGDKGGAGLDWFPRLPASPPPPHTAQPRPAATPNRILVTLGSDMLCLASSLEVQALGPLVSFPVRHPPEQPLRLKDAILNFPL